MEVIVRKYKQIDNIISQKLTDEIDMRFPLDGVIDFMVENTGDVDAIILDSTRLPAGGAPISFSQPNTEYLLEREGDLRVRFDKTGVAPDIKEIVITMQIYTDQGEKQIC
jgi:hypothetical protein